LISAESPELVALGFSSQVDAAKMAVAFNDPEHLLEHITLDELHRIREGCWRLISLQKQIAHALGVYAARFEAPRES
jgi:hypothetical protein